jgi:hypothetical protein
LSIVTLDAVKAQLNIPASDTSQDIELLTYMDAATGAAEIARGEVLEQRTVVDEVRFSGSVTSWLLESVPVVSLTSIAAVDGSQTWSVDPSAMHVEARSGRVTVLSGPPLTGLVAISYLAGYVSLPTKFRLAALIIIQHLWETQRGTMGVQLGGDAETYTPGRGFAIPRRALELLGLSLPGVA